MGRNGPHYADIDHVGYKAERTIYPDGDLERALAHAWVEQNRTYNGNFLDLMLGDGDEREVLSQRDARIAATAIQWLGSNSGFAFLCRVLRECGYRVIEGEGRSGAMKASELIAALERGKVIHDDQGAELYLSRQNGASTLRYCGWGSAKEKPEEGLARAVRDPGRWAVGKAEASGGVCDCPSHTAVEEPGGEVGLWVDFAEAVASGEQALAAGTAGRLAGLYEMEGPFADYFAEQLFRRGVRALLASYYAGRRDDEIMAGLRLFYEGERHARGEGDATANPPL